MVPKRKQPSADEDLVDEEPPTSINPYEVLQVPENASVDEIKKAYRKAALKHHPDKATNPADAATANETFQRIAFAYAILSDPARRKLYDATGSTSEVLTDLGDDFDWKEYYAAQYADVVTEDSIARFSESYKGGDEERADLLAAFDAAKGNLDRVYATVMLSDPLEDDARFRGIIDAAIEAGEVEGWKSYVEESEKSKERRLKRARDTAAREAKEAKVEKERLKNEKGKSAQGGMGDLAALIRQRQNDRGAMGVQFFDRLEEKYGGGGSKGKGKPAKRKKGDEDLAGEGEVDEPPEEAFRAMGERMQKAKASTSAKENDETRPKKAKKVAGK